MILSQGKYPFGTIITRMSWNDLEFVVSTAKEGLLKGLTTHVQIPRDNTAIKIFYMPSMNTPAIHLIHKQFVDSIEENLAEGMHLAIILDELVKSLKDHNIAQEIVVDYHLTEYIANLRKEQFDAHSF